MSGSAPDAADPQALLDEAISDHQHGRTADARQKYLRVLELSPGQPDVLHLVGVTLYQDDRLTEAEGYIRGAIAVNPEKKDYYSNLGLVLKTDKRYEEAITCFLQALAIDPVFADCLNNLGSAYVAAGRTAEAEESFRQLLDIDPDHVEACNNLAVILGASSCGEEAMRLYEHALALRPNYGDAHLNYARMLYRCNVYDKAVAHFEAALGIEDSGVAVYRELADSLRHAGRIDEAMTVSQAALELAPDDPDCHVAVGSVYQHQGNLEAAEACYRRALDIDSNHARANNNIGTVLEAGNELTEALEHFTTAIKSDPDLAEAILNKGVALQKSGRLAEAAGYFSMAIVRNPRLPSAYRFLSEIYRVSEMRDAQIKVLQHWLEVFPDSATAMHLLQAAENESIPDRASDEYIREEFDGFADSFDETLAGLEYRTPNLVGELLCAQYADVAEQLDVLDAGCGTGLCGTHLKPFSRSLVGVDLSTRMLEKAADRGLYSELVAAELVGFMNSNRRSYDLIVSADTLVYFGALNDVFAAAASALRPGGRLLFSVERLEEGIDGFRLNPSGRYAHGEEYLRANLAAFGFEIERTDPVTLRTEAQQPVGGLLVLGRLVLDGEPPN